MKSNITERIQAIKAEQGSRLVLMGHHYQNDSVIRHMDLTGDSLELARKVPHLTTAETIVFCGVSFMAETADMLAGNKQKVLLPAPAAGCIMSNMAPSTLLESVLEKLCNNGRRIIPLAYVNTSAAIKAVVAQYGGSVCTSANAETMLKWALQQGDGVLFLPDKNLAANTADSLGIPENKRLVLDIRRGGDNIDPQAISDKTLVIWPGLCAIHHRFKPEHITDVRYRDPDANVIVHPECMPEVVKKADAAGSTSFIIKYCEEAPEGAAIYVGTEINLVERLAKQYRGRKLIRPLHPSHCENMAKTTEAILHATLEQLDTFEPVKVPYEISAKASIALERMLDACS